MSNKPFTIERIFNAPVEKVWKAISDRDEMEKWYFNLVEFRPEIGFEFQFTGGPPDGIQYLHKCKITEVIPGQKLKHSWAYEGYAGESYVTWELIPEGDKTRVRLTHEGLETFPQDNPDFAAKNFGEGWTHIVGTSLRNYLES